MQDQNSKLPATLPPSTPSASAELPARPTLREQKDCTPDLRYYKWKYVDEDDFAEYANECERQMLTQTQRIAELASALRSLLRWQNRRESQEFAYAIHDGLAALRNLEEPARV